MSRYERSSPGSVAAILLAMVLLGAGPRYAVAQGWVEPVHSLRGAWVQRVQSKVRVEVEGNVATVVVDEWFEAHGHALGEADYLYPLPPDAVFNGFSLYQGGEELRGEVMDAGRAREVYEAIVRKRRDPALIELAGHGLLRARIFPLAPGETRRVTLRYSHMLERAGDALHLRYSTGIPQARECGSDAPHPENGCSPTPPPMDFELRARGGEAFMTPFSPTHLVTTDREGKVLVVRATGAAVGTLSLFLPLAREGLGLTLVTHKPRGEDGYFLLSLTPGKGDLPPQPRDVTVVLDVSGSMSGEKIRQARAALLNILETLSGADRFRLIAFSNAVRPFDLEWRPSGSKDLAEARAWVAGLEADGGTNVSGALDEALRLESPGDRLPVTLFLTDGLPTVGETSIESILEKVAGGRGRVRVFAFGVGHDVNTTLLDRMTQEGRGSTTYVSPGESVERALGLLATKIRYPVLTDLALTGAAVRVKEIYPVEIPDVFAGEELVLFGRYETDGDTEVGRIALEGRRGGERAHFETEATFPNLEERNAFIPRLWASRKLGFLSRRIWTEGETDELVKEIRETALRYGIPSPYTSYLVLEGDTPAERVLKAGGGLDPIATASGALRSPGPNQGAEAVGRARLAKSFRDVASMSDLRAAEEEAVGLPGEGDASVRLVAGRLFREHDGVWKQVGRRDTGPILRIEPFSRAYFQILERIPELKPYALDLPQLELQGVALRIGIQDGGRTTLSEEDLERARVRFLSGEDEQR